MEAAAAVSGGVQSSSSSGSSTGSSNGSRRRARGQQTKAGMQAMEMELPPGTGAPAPASTALAGDEYYGGEDDFDFDEDADTMHYRRPALNIRKPPPPKTTLAAALMLVVGTLMLCMGAFVFLFHHQEKSRGSAMMILGAIMFIPGSYASYTLYGAYKRWPGFEYSQVPSYDD